MLKTQIELKDETIDNLKSKISAFAADTKKGVGLANAAGIEAAARPQGRDHQAHV